MGIGTLQFSSVSGATGEMMTEESNCQYVAQLPSAIPQLVLMGLSDNELVVEPACKVIGAFHNGGFSYATQSLPCCGPCSDGTFTRYWACLSR